MDKIQFIAEFRYACWVSYQIAAGQPYNIEMNDDQRSSLYDGVQYMLTYPDITCEQSHTNWVNMKIARGWLWGPVKDFDKKTHPDLVSFSDLPDIEKLKDVASMAAHREAVRLWNQIYNIKVMSDSSLVGELDRRGYVVISVDDINDIKDTMESWKP